MSIVRMKKIRILALREQRDDLLAGLIRFGNMEVSESEALLSDPENAAVLKPETSSLVQLHADQSTLQRALEILNRQAPVKSSLFSPLPEAALDSVMDEQALSQNIRQAEEITALEEKIRSLDSEIAGVQNSIAALKPWAPLDMPLNFSASRCVAAVKGCLPEETAAELLQQTVLSVSEDLQLYRVSTEGGMQYFLLLCMKSEKNDICAAAREIGFEEISFPGRGQTAKENIAELNRRLSELQKQRSSCDKELSDAAARREELQLGLDRMAASVARAEAREKLCGTDTVVVMEGWCPVDKQTELQTLLESFDCAWEFSDPSEEEYPQVPVRLKNNVFTRALNMVTEMYSLPAYDGTDPNPLMAPFFILFYGMMMADMGYGLLMVLAAIVVLKKMRPRESMRNFADLLLYCGISTTVFGALTGGFFGDFIPQVAAIINPNTSFKALPALFTPLEDTMSILIGALCLGAIQTITGMAVSVRNKFRSGQALEAVFDEITWWLILAGLGLLFLKIGNVAGYPVVLLLGCAMLVVGQFILKKSIGDGLVGILVAIYNGATGFFSDILSYSRLMALMLSGSIIATVFNTLGTIPGGPVPVRLLFFVVISAFGNGLNFALNILGCYVHDLRLQCLEFFGRFYKDGGRAFAPLHLNTKYVDIIKEEN